MREPIVSMKREQNVLWRTNERTYYWHIICLQVIDFIIFFIKENRENQRTYFNSIFLDVIIFP
jgi:hypothetical protein